MLSWICPECGRECAPNHRECPACSEGVLALAGAVEARASAQAQVGVNGGGRPRTSVSVISTERNGDANGRSAVTAEPRIPCDPLALAIALEAQVQEYLEEQARMAAAREAAAREAAEREAAEAAAREAELREAAEREAAEAVARETAAREVAEREAAEAAAREAEAREAAEREAAEAVAREAAAKEAAEREAAEAAAREAEAREAAEREAAEQEAAEREAAAREAAAREAAEREAAEAAAREAEAREAAEREAAEAVAREAAAREAAEREAAEAVAREAEAREAAERQIEREAAEREAAERAAVLQAEECLYWANIGPIVDSFKANPGVSLLPSAENILEIPAPSIEQRLDTPRPAIAFRSPKDDALSVGVAPQAPPLAGPCLPPNLENFREAPRVALPGAHGRHKLPTWLVSLVVAVVLFLVAGSVLQNLTANRDSGQPAGPVQGQQTTVNAAGQDEHPLARAVEVTGLRVVVDLHKHAQLQYIVVNHSATPLSGVQLHIAVRSASGGSTAEPLFRVAAMVPTLGAFESKEIRTDLDTLLRTAQIPDWQDLRADVQVTPAQ